jgi:hypothetical protein
VLARGTAPATAKLELTDCGEVKRIIREPISAGNRMNLFEPAFRTLVLCDRYGAIQRDNWGRPYLQ